MLLDDSNTRRTGAGRVLGNSGPLPGEDRL